MKFLSIFTAIFLFASFSTSFSNPVENPAAPQSPSMPLPSSTDPPECVPLQIVMSKLLEDKFGLVWFGKTAPDKTVVIMNDKRGNWVEFLVLGIPADLDSTTDVSKLHPMACRLLDGGAGSPGVNI